MDPGEGVLVLVLHVIKDRLHGLPLPERRSQPVLQRRVLPRQVVHLRLHLRNQPPQLVEKVCQINELLAYIYSKG
jgi:hypothetical protein